MKKDKEAANEVERHQIVLSPSPPMGRGRRGWWSDGSCDNGRIKVYVGVKKGYIVVRRGVVKSFGVFG